MSTFKTEALVLSKRPLKNADRLYILYSPEFGKLEAKLRSAASSKSKIAGQIEPLCLSQIMVAKGKEMEIVAGALLIKNYDFSDLRIQSLAGLAAEMVSRFIKPGLPDKEIYQLIQSYFDALQAKDTAWRKNEPGSNGSGLSLLSLRFIWQMLIHLGYKIDLSQSSDRLLPELSLEAKSLLSDCLKTRSELTILQSSSKVIDELINFTQSYLRYFLEGDLKAYYLSFYAKKP